jgi:deoxyribodipyrimidine photolyase
MTELYWFRNDLWAEDNPGLAQHASARKFFCLYFWPPVTPLVQPYRHVPAAGAFPP